MNNAPPPNSGSPDSNLQVPDMNLGCPHCQAWLAVPATEAGQVYACPKCGGHFNVPMPTARHFNGGLDSPPEFREFTGKKVAAGICGILLGCFGVHKFILGLNQPAMIMLFVTLAGMITGSCIIVPILASIAMAGIGVVEGLIYLTRSDEDFYETYAIRKKEWL